MYFLFVHVEKEIEKAIPFSGYVDHACLSVPLDVSLGNPQLSVNNLTFFILCAPNNFNLSSPHKNSKRSKKGIFLKNVPLGFPIGGLPMGRGHV